MDAHFLRVVVPDVLGRACRAQPSAGGCDSNPRRCRGGLNKMGRQHRAIAGFTMSNGAPFALQDFAASAPVQAGTQAVPAIDLATLKVIYIAGDGRSGSTLLDRLIGIYPGVFSCG